MARILLIFDDEVAAYPVEQICKDNEIPHRRAELKDDDDVIITEDSNADVICSIMVDYEMKHKILPAEYKGNEIKSEEIVPTESKVSGISVDGKYIVSGEWLLGLKKLEKWLYDGAFSDAHQQPGKIRDWANWLNQGFFNQIESNKL